MESQYNTWTVSIFADRCPGIGAPTRLFSCAIKQRFAAIDRRLHAAQADDDVSVAVLRGAGRAFSAGADTSVPRPLTAENRPNLIKHCDAKIALTKLPGRIDKLIIAAVHGHVPGAGAGPAFGWDLVIAAESARFGYPELKAGLTAATVTAQAVHLMGRKVAFGLLTLCENMLPQRAYEPGIVNRVVPDARLLDKAMAVAERLAGWNKLRLWQTKRVFQRSLSMDLDMDKALKLGRDVLVMMGRFPT